MVDFVTGLRCRECQRAFPAEALHVCDYCFGPLEVAYDYERVFLDTTMVFTDFFDAAARFPAGGLPLARELGLAGKILLGSDFPNIPYPYARQLAGLARLGLGADWLRAVCWDNPVALFGSSSPRLITPPG